ncbi:hypothetical protein CferDRAFT_1698 [Chlorobium ferrooxidans DSM 13031]|uniref:DUF4407 domain-containing protein n=2 Tax=Chlorobium TaxID=1091 RepID=Q0YU64_9CHLB|nr:hypothetical protein CferDRAFT_1698 [Chlorobium ferrooxidans DSM 13031]
MSVHMSTMTFSRLQRFFWICSGTPVSVIEKYPTEHSKYIGIGATIFFTAFFAGLSGGYALYFVFAGSAFAGLWALLFGLIWGLAIFNLDRYIVSGINKSSKGLKQFYQASPRLIFAVLIALVIARPLELKIFDKEIREQLRLRYLSDQREMIGKVQSSFREKYALELGQIAGYQKEYDSLSSEVNRLREELKAEVFGSHTATTSGVEGYGTYARNKELVVKAKQTRLEFLAAQLAGLQEYMNRQKAAEGINAQSIQNEKEMDQAVAVAGFADRNWALGELTHSANDVSRSSANAVTFITLLFIAFECAPLIVKLLSDIGPSDVDIREAESRIISQLTSSTFLSRTRIVREYRTPGSKKGGRRAKRYLSNKRW